jgi:hypothetical protein
MPLVTKFDVPDTAAGATTPDDGAARRYGLFIGLAATIAKIELAEVPTCSRTAPEKTAINLRSKLQAKTWLDCEAGSLPPPTAFSRGGV